MDHRIYTNHWFISIVEIPVSRVLLWLRRSRATEGLPRLCLEVNADAVLGRGGAGAATLMKGGEVSRAPPELGSRQIGERLAGGGTSKLA